MGEKDYTKDGDVAAERRHSEVDSLLLSIEKEISVLHDSVHEFINSVAQGLEPINEGQPVKDFTEEPEARPTSPIGEELSRHLASIKSARRKLVSAREQVRI